MSLTDLLNNAADYAHWHAVPDDVIELYVYALPVARHVKQAAGRAPVDVFYRPAAQELIVVGEEKIADLVNVPYVNTVRQCRELESDAVDWVQVKHAAVADYLAPIKSMYSVPAEALGRLTGAAGATPLSSTIVGGALTGLGGYAAGHLYNNMVAKPLHRAFPKWFSGQTIAPGALGVLGAAVGAGLPAWYGSAVARNGGRLNGSEGYRGPGNNDLYDSSKIPADFAKIAAVKLADEYAGLASQAGSLFAPSIPVDAFNNAVWSDAIQPQNPFGTKDPFGDNRQSLRTPPYAAAAVSGLVAGASAARGGQPYVSPFDVARVAAGAGAGAVSGVMVGKLLGAIAGLTPEAQNHLKQLGTWSGLIQSAANTLF